MGGRELGGKKLMIRLMEGAGGGEPKYGRELGIRAGNRR